MLLNQNTVGLLIDLLTQLYTVRNGSVTMTIESSTYRATTLSRMNLSGYVGHVTIFSSMFTIACCFRLGLGLGFIRFIFIRFRVWLVIVIHTHLYYFRLSLSHCR